MKTLKAYFVLAAASAALSLGAISPASATINVGDILQIQYFNPDLSTLVDAASTTFTGPGTELNIYFDTVTATFDPNQITLTQNWFGGYTPATFNGFEISDLTNSQAFAG